MAHGRATLLLYLGKGRLRCGRVRLVVRLLPVRRELVLTFELPFEFDLVQLLLKSLVFGEQSRTPFAFGVERPQQISSILFILIRP